MNKDININERISYYKNQIKACEEAEQWIMKSYWESELQWLEQLKEYLEIRIQECCDFECCQEELQKLLSESKESNDER